MKVLLYAVFKDLAAGIFVAGHLIIVEDNFGVRRLDLDSNILEKTLVARFGISVIAIRVTNLSLCRVARD